MQLAAVVKARTLAMFEIDELNLGGKLRLYDCIAPIVDKFEFLVFPSKLEDFDLEKGVKFQSGKLAEVVISELMIYSGAVYVETLSSTGDSKKVLLEILSWGKSKLGFTYREEMIRQWAYISQLVFSTDVPILEKMSTPVEKLAEKTSAFMEDLFGLKYEPTTLTIGHDPVKRNHGIAGLNIQRRANAEFSKNKYYSEAPMPTSLHLKLLEEFEADVLAAMK